MPPVHVGSGPQAGSAPQSAQLHFSPTVHLPSGAPSHSVRHWGFVAQSWQTQPSLKGSQTPSSLQFAGSEQNGSVSQSMQTQSSALVHIPSVTHIDWQPGSTVQSAHAHDSPASQLPSAAPPSHSLPPPPWPPMPPMPPPPWLMPPVPVAPLCMPPAPPVPVSIPVLVEVVVLSVAVSSPPQPASVSTLAREVMAKASSVNRISTP
jgi:hypothetical protein